MQSSRTISQLRASASTMPYPDVMGPLFVFNIDIRGADWSCTPPGSFDDRYYGISPEAKAALKAMPKQGITPILTATPSPTPTRTGTPTHTPTVTPTYTRTPFGTPARKAFLPLISRLRAIGW
jgi:hypothetical protein